MKQTDLIFPKRLKKLRGSRTQMEFSLELGIERVTLAAYEKGTRVPSALILKQIAERCEVSADWLLGLSDSKSVYVSVDGSSTGLGGDSMRWLSAIQHQLRKKRLSSVLPDLLDIPIFRRLLIECAEMKAKACPLSERSSYYDEEAEAFVNREIENFDIPERLRENLGISTAPPIVACCGRNYLDFIRLRIVDDFSYVLHTAMNRWVKEE